MPGFDRYIGIDYSGAETPREPEGPARLSGGRATPPEVLPPPSPRKYWTRRGIAEWLVERLAEDVPTLVGIDHGFSFPLRYFEAHGLPPDWPDFLDDFQRHWPTDADHTYVDFVRDGLRGDGAARMGNPRWRRLCEERCRAQVGLPFRRAGLGGEIHPCRHSLAALLCAGNSGSGSISGPSMAGTFPPAARRLPRSIRPCGSMPTRRRIARPISTMPIPSPPGCARQIAMAGWRRHSRPH